MGIELPALDGRIYRMLLGELLERIPALSPGWTDFNASDPGVTLVEIFEFAAESLLWQIDKRERQRRRQRRLALLVAGAAGAGLALWTWSHVRQSRD